MKRLVMAVLALILTLGLATAWIGYGNPFREVPFYKYEPDGSDISHLFYVDHCNEGGTCELKPTHERVMHFSFGDGRRGHPGRIDGEGRNPIAMLRGIGLSAIPRPDYAKAALKWCTSSEILQEFRYHGRRFVVPLTSDPLGTAKCVQRYIPRRFTVCIADPIGRGEDCDQFASLEDRWQ